MHSVEGLEYIRRGEEGNQMITCEELDVLHKEAVIESMALCHRLHYAAHTVKDRALTGRIADSMQEVAVNYASKLHTFLGQEGFLTAYKPAPYGEKEVIHLYLNNNDTTFMGYHHTIVVTIHPRHHTLIYYNGPPFMGTIQKLVRRLHDDRSKMLAREQCRGCHYINTDLWVCGMGKVLDAECRNYIPISES